MNFRSILVAAALAATSSSFAATCTTSFALGSMGPPESKAIGNDFNSATKFTDCYDFSIVSAATAGGTTKEADAKFLFFPRTIDLFTVSLFTALGTQIGTADSSTSSFSFSNLLAGNYQLRVGGETSYGIGKAGYSGTLTTSQSAVASAVPEAPLTAMLAMAMIGAGLVTRRAKRG